MRYAIQNSCCRMCTLFPLYKAKYGFTQSRDSQNVHVPYYLLFLCIIFMVFVLVLFLVKALIDWEKWQDFIIDCLFRNRIFHVGECKWLFSILPGEKSGLGRCNTLRMSSRLFLVGLSILSRDSWLTSESKLPFGDDNNNSSSDISVTTTPVCVLWWRNRQIPPPPNR